MSRYLVDVCHYTHTCPASDAAPHVVDTRRAVVKQSPGGHQAGTDNGTTTTRRVTGQSSWKACPAAALTPSR